MDNNEQSAVEADRSTVLATETPTDNGAGRVETMEETIGRAYDEVTAKSEAAKVEADEKAAKAADDAKAKVAEKEATEKAEVKPAKEEPQEKTEQPEKAAKGAPEKAAAGQEVQERRQSEGRQHSEPPARFLPEARTKWANVPNEVKAEFHRISQEMEGEIGKSKAAADRYEQFRQYDELAKSNGRDFATDSIPKVIQFEQMIRQNPIAAMEFALKETGSQYSLYDVAQAIVQRGPQAVQQVMQQPAQQAQPNHEIQALKAEIQSMRVEQQVMPVITAFQQSHPDFEAVSGKIEQILQTGVIDQMYGTGLSLEQKLSEAYRMAGGSLPSRSEPEALPAHSEADPRPVNPDAGLKSVRGNLNGGFDPAKRGRAKTHDDAINAALAEFGM